MASGPTLILQEARMGYAIETISELITNMGHSTDQGFVGVSLIFIYLAWIVAMALWRINQSKHDH
jgi:hypothetical protein